MLTLAFLLPSEHRGFGLIDIKDSFGSDLNGRPIGLGWFCLDFFPLSVLHSKPTYISLLQLFTPALSVLMLTSRGTVCFPWWDIYSKVVSSVEM